MTKLIRAVALVAFATLFATGCLKRTVIRLDDHPDRPVSIMETIDEQLWTRTHQFWLCKDSATGLTCEKTCDGKTDLTCHNGSNLKQ